MRTPLSEEQLRVLFEDPQFPSCRLVPAPLLRGDIAPGDASGDDPDGIVIGFGDVDAREVYPPEHILIPHRTSSGLYFAPEDVPVLLSLIERIEAAQSPAEGSDPATEARVLRSRILGAGMDAETPFGVWATLLREVEGDPSLTELLTSRVSEHRLRALRWWTSAPRVDGSIMSPGADLAEADLTGADLEGADLEGADLQRANLTGANLRRANLAGTEGQGLLLWKANLEGANLTEARWPSANLYGANLAGARLVGANLYAAVFYGASLEGANLEGASLYCANLAETDLQGARLVRAELGSSAFKPTRAAGADLTGANLEGADLREAHLQGASLVEARLVGADLQGADLTGTKVTRAQLMTARSRP